MFEHFINLMQAALTFFYNITVKFGFPSYGVAIILFTIVIRMLIFPLTAKQMKSMNLMKKLGPQIKEIQRKYQNDQQSGQKKIAELYKNSGVNPLAGCLPLILQMPILSGMFYALRNYNYLNHPNFLWIKTLSGTDRFYILPLLVALTTLISSLQGLSDTNPGQSKIMVIAMPMIIGYMTLHFPAGVSLYWLVSNFIQIIQQRILRKVYAS